MVDEIPEARAMRDISAKLLLYATARTFLIPELKTALLEDLKNVLSWRPEQWNPPTAKAIVLHFIGTVLGMLPSLEDDLATLTTQVCRHYLPSINTDPGFLEMLKNEPELSCKLIESLFPDRRGTCFMYVRCKVGECPAFHAAPK